ncbi:glycerate kinase [Segetibacter sp. 3557_3]|uniref:glycerate kinase n=1 Tax=Segetibacter sp. 3557_3 TaxID=2547429 RepID=UPI001058FABB|nr:glycerate kinase [Segetibacter sp. 3557_3]TDH21631.1 glycerate kinase [Segetibacter sp. 3557_3]
MKIIVAPDKFKENLTSFELCAAIAEGISIVDDTIDIVQLPLADGGDGFVNVLGHYLKTTSVGCDTVDALGRPIVVHYGWSASAKTALIELASASGLAGIQPHERNPMLTSTYGTGLLMKDAIARGAKEIIIGIGGSATNDGGTGLLAALGYTFRNHRQEVVPPMGKNLGEIAEIIAPDQAVAIPIIVACDVDNPLLGVNGATHTYGAQKGADRLQIDELEKGMKQFAELLETFMGKPVSEMPGAGAAGGTGAGLMLLADVSLQKGIEIVFKHSDIRTHLKNTDLVITAEGTFDKQTMHGKALHALANEAAKMDVPVMAVCGAVAIEPACYTSSGFSFVASITDGPMSLEESKARAYELVRNKVIALVYLFKTMKQV